MYEKGVWGDSRPEGACVKSRVMFQITRQDEIAQCECGELDARWLDMELCEPLAVGRLPTSRSQVGEEEPAKSARWA